MAPLIMIPNSPANIKQICEAILNDPRSEEEEKRDELEYIKIYNNWRKKGSILAKYTTINKYISTISDEDISKILSMANKNKINDEGISIILSIANKNKVDT